MGKKKDQANSTLVSFVGGPRDGDTMQVCVPPVPYMKLAMPDWAVYQLDDDVYRLLYEGPAARQWRNPIASIFVRAIRGVPDPSLLDLVEGEEES